MRSGSSLLRVSLVASVACAACSKPHGPPPPASAKAEVAPPPEAAPAETPDAGATAAAAAGEGVPGDAGARAPEATADGGAAPAPAAGAVPAAPPKVKVVTIGMHVGGGPYDEITKEPLKRSVEPRFADLQECWQHAPAGTGQIDAGVDLVVEAKGGKAKVSNPRSLLKNDAFVACVVAFFESVEFLPPKSGRTTVSYSVRFTPKP